MKLLKLVLLPLSLILAILFREQIISAIVSSNLKSSQGNLLFLTFIYWLELIFCLCLYDFSILQIYRFLDYYIGEFGRFAIRKKIVGIALFTIRLNYYWLRVCKFLRLGWVVYGSRETSSVWLGLSKQPIFLSIATLFRVIFNIPVALAFLLSCFSLDIFTTDIAYYLPKIQDLLKNISQVKVNIGDVFSRLPALVALTTLVPVIFFFYFYSQKREIRKIIDKENSQYFEEVVLLYEKLLLWVDKHIYEISENFDYVINVQDLIVDLILDKEIPNYSSLNEIYSRSLRTIPEYRFIELPNLNELQEIVDKLSSHRLRRFTRLFSVKQYDIWNLYWSEFRSLRKLEHLQRSFYTREGMEIKLRKRHTYSVTLSKERMEKKKAEEEGLVAWSIYDSLQLLYKLRRASNALRRYLYSSRVERLILKALNKEK